MTSFLRHKFEEKEAPTVHAAAFLPVTPWTPDRLAFSFMHPLMHELTSAAPCT